MTENESLWEMLAKNKARVSSFHAKLKTEEGQKLVAASLKNNAFFQHLKSKSTNQ